MARLVVATTVLSSFGLALAQQDPWPMERHDRWGSGRASVGPAASTLTSPWVFMDLSNNGTPVSNGPCIAADGTAYFGDWINDLLYKFDTTTGSILGTFPTQNFVACTPAISGSQVFLDTSSPTANMFAVDSVSMASEWSTVQASSAGSPIVGPDGSVVADFADGSITRYDPGTGATLWSYLGTGSGGGTPAFSRNDKLVFFPNGTHMTALNWTDGSVAWDLSLGSTVAPAGVADSGTVVFGVGAGTVYAVKPATGQTLWTFTAQGSCPASPAFSPDGSVCYVGSNDFNLYALNVASGQKNWAFTASNGLAFPPTVGKDGSIYVFNPSADLYRISPLGAQVWTEHLLGQARGPLTIGPDATLYVGYTGDNSQSGLAIIRQQSVSEPVASITMNDGTIVSGNLASLKKVDQNYLKMAAGSGQPPISVTLTATAPFPGLSSFTVAINSAVNVTGYTQSIEIYNNSTGNWDVVDSRPAPTSDTLVDVNVTSNASNYLNTSNRNVLIREIWFATASSSSTTLQSRIDVAQLTNVVPTFQQ